MTGKNDALEGSIPKGPINADTEFVFVAGLAFVNAVKHEEVVNHHVRRVEELEAEIKRLATDLLIAKGLRPPQGR